jgi:hypothetical protein
MPTFDRETKGGLILIGLLLLAWVGIAIVGSR